MKRETLPIDACVWFYECERCKMVLRPKPGDCCVYCSYGTTSCPPVQQPSSCRAVIETRELLRLLASSDDAASGIDISEIATRLLRHYPLDVDLAVSAAALPGVGAPLAR